jgi:hypothetical protein
VWFIADRAVRITIADTHVQVSKQQIDAPVHDIIVEPGQF